MKQKTVYILLASFNGEKFISQQIESIIQQTYKNWKLIIRDDGSTDAVVSIIQQYANRFPEQIVLVKDNLGNLGSTANFNVLFQNAKHAEYIMFSDQDDVWLPNKIELTIGEMIKNENTFSLQTPLLVYTNFIYSDNNLNPIASKKNFSSTKVDELKFEHLLAQNPAHGCTMLLNKKLIETIDCISAAAENHDYWIALVAAAFGKIIYLHQPTVLYRQHQLNISGQHDNSSLKKRLTRNIISKKIFEDIQRKFRMAAQFKKQYQKLLSTEQNNLLNDFVQLSNSKNLVLLFKNFKRGIKRQTMPQTFLFYLAILLKRKTLI